MRSTEREMVAARSLRSSMSRSARIPCYDCRPGAGVIHRGSMATIGDSWQALARHIDDRGLESIGACREVYLETPMDDQSVG